MTKACCGFVHGSPSYAIQVKIAMMRPSSKAITLVPVEVIAALLA